MYGTVDPSSNRIFHFWLMTVKMNATRLYIYFPYGEMSNTELQLIDSLVPY